MVDVLRNVKKKKTKTTPDAGRMGAKFTHSRQVAGNIRDGAIVIVKTMRRYPNGESSIASGAKFALSVRKRARRKLSENRGKRAAHCKATPCLSGCSAGNRNSERRSSGFERAGSQWHSEKRNSASRAEARPAECTSSAMPYERRD